MSAVVFGRTQVVLRGDYDVRATSRNRLGTFRYVRNLRLIVSSVIRRYRTVCCRRSESEHLTPCHSSEVTATSVAASGPFSSRTANPASSRRGTPSLTALSYLDPGLSPKTTNPVFLDTELDTLPPRACTAAVAESRLWLSSEPVITT